MKYLICKDFNEDDYDKVFISTEEENVEKNDLVVYNNYDTPSLAKVIAFQDELTAITSDTHYLEAIKVVSMKQYLEKKAKEIQKAKLIKMMKEQIEISSLEEKLKKNSECNPEMSKLFEQYKSLSD